MKILLLGATGLVGGKVLQLALDHPQVTDVIAPVRRALSVAHEKLNAPIIDFEDLKKDSKDWQFDAVICALGTTMKKAKSKAAFKKIDYDYPLAFAAIAIEKGAKIYALNSAMGVSAKSPFFYSKVKGQLEDQLKQLGFESLILVRPGLIEGQREELRLGEEIALKVSHLLQPILPKALRPNKAENIAQALLAHTLQPKSGVQVVCAQDML